MSKSDKLERFIDGRIWAIAITDLMIVASCITIRLMG